jgi:stage III sporulation protein AA
MLNYISNYSLYAYKEEIKQGYITIEGGHRVGVAGQTVLVDGKIAGISPITFLNIRIAHEKCGCAKKILPLIRQKNSIYNTLILSMPGAGKTTLLRDSIRALSNGEAYGIRLKVCVVDERSEIAASFHGVPQNDMGPRTDVMDGCGKAEGMQLLIRSMSPQIIAVDELGAESDFYAVEQALNCGSRVLGTIHAGNMKELSEKPYLKRWMERRLFQRFIFLEKETNGRRKMQVYDEHMERITC